MAEEIKNENEKSKWNQFTEWLNVHSDDIFAGAIVLGAIGAVTGLCVASVKADERIKKAALEEAAANRQLQEKWMDTQLECARIEADAIVRKQTATTNDIAEIVKAIAKE